MILGEDLRTWLPDPIECHENRPGREDENQYNFHPTLARII